MKEGQQAGSSLASNVSSFDDNDQMVASLESIERPFSPVPCHGGLNENCPHRFIDLKTRSPIGGTILGGQDCGGVRLYWRKRISGVGFESSWPYFWFAPRVVFLVEEASS